MTAGRSLAGRRRQVTRIHEVCRYIRLHCGDRLRVADLAQLAGVSASYLQRSFRGAMRMSVHEYVLRARVIRAGILLRAGHSLRDTARACGFANKSHLARVMARRTGKRPGELRVPGRVIQR